MPRKGPVVKTPVVADPVYNSPVVTALINRVLLHGKRSTAEALAAQLFNQFSSDQMHLTQVGHIGALHFQMPMLNRCSSMGITFNSLASNELNNALCMLGERVLRRQMHTNNCGWQVLRPCQCTPRHRRNGSQLIDCQLVRGFWNQSNDLACLVIRMCCIAHAHK